MTKSSSPDSDQEKKLLGKRPLPPSSSTEQTVRDLLKIQESDIDDFEKLKKVEILVSSLTDDVDLDECIKQAGFEQQKKVYKRYDSQDSNYLPR